MKAKDAWHVVRGDIVSSFSASHYDRTDKVDTGIGSFGVMSVGKTFVCSVILLKFDKKLLPLVLTNHGDLLRM